MGSKVPQKAPNRVFIVGKVFPDPPGTPPEGPRVWEFMGVFISEDLAVAACTTPRHFVGPALLNERIRDEPIPWPGGWYPKGDM